METFSALLAICAGNSPVPGEFPAQRPVTRSFDVFFDLRLNKQLSHQTWGWWYETLSRPLWRHRNDILNSHSAIADIKYANSCVVFCRTTCQHWFWHLLCLVLNDSTDIDPRENGKNANKEGFRFLYITSNLHRVMALCNYVLIWELICQIRYLLQG